MIKIVHSLIMNQEQQPLIKMTRTKKVGRVKRVIHPSQNLKSGLDATALKKYVLDLISTLQFSLGYHL